MKLLNKINHFKSGLTAEMSFWDFFAESAGVIKNSKTHDIVPWLVTQIIMLFLTYKIPAIAVLKHLPKKSQRLNSNPSVKEVFSVINNETTKKGAEYIEKLSNNESYFKIVNSKWIMGVGFVPNMNTNAIGTLNVSFKPSATKGPKNPGGKKPVITPPWITRRTWRQIMRATSKGRAYLDNIAIGNADIVRNIAKFALRDKFLDQLIYSRNIKGMNDLVAYDHIVKNSNQLLKEMPGLKKVVDVAKKNKIIAAIFARNKLTQHKINQQENVNIKTFKLIENKKLKNLAEIQRVIKRMARFTKNPGGSIKNELKQFASLVTPNYKYISTIYDIGFRQGRFTKQKLAHSLKKDTASFSNKAFKTPMDLTRKKMILKELRGRANYAQLIGDTDLEIELLDSYNKIYETITPEGIKKERRNFKLLRKTKSTILNNTKTRSVKAAVKSMIRYNSKPQKQSWETRHRKMVARTKTKKHWRKNKKY